MVNTTSWKHFHYFNNVEDMARGLLDKHLPGSQIHSHRLEELQHVVTEDSSKLLVAKIGCKSARSGGPLEYSHFVPPRSKLWADIVVEHHGLETRMNLGV